MSANATSTAPKGRKKLAQGKKRSAAALGHDSQNTSRPEGAKESVAIPLPDLPKSWRYASVSEMGTTGEQAVLTGPFGSNLGREDFIDSGIPLLTISCLTDQGIRMDKALFVSDAKAKELQRYRLKTGDLLFSRMASVGRAGIIGPDLEGALFNYHIMRLRLDESKLLPKFFTGYVRGAKQVRDYLLAVNHGATRDGINTEQLLAMPVIVAPLSEQRRIVAEIEKQFTRLEAGVAALRRAQANLKRYRAAVLKAACEGQLVPTEAELHRQRKTKTAKLETGAELLTRILAERRKNWEESNRKSKIGNRKYREPAVPDTANLPPLPEGWTWANVEQLLVESMCNGISIKGTDDPPGIRTLRLSAMSSVGFDYSDARYLPLSNSDVDDLWIQSGDFFVSRGNGSLHLVGRGTLAQPAPTPTIFPDTMIRLRLARLMQSLRWIPTIWPSYVVRSQIERMVKTTAGIYKIAQPQVGQIAIPLPPLAEQTRIVAEVERRLSVVEELESVVSANLQRAVRLRQSILQKAFTGELV